MTLKQSAQVGLGLIGVSTIFWIACRFGGIPYNLATLIVIGPLYYTGLIIFSIGVANNLSTARTLGAVLAVATAGSLFRFGLNRGWYPMVLSSSFLRETASFLNHGFVSLLFFHVPMLLLLTHLFNRGEFKRASNYLCVSMGCVLIGVLRMGLGITSFMSTLYESGWMNEYVDFSFVLVGYSLAPMMLMGAFVVFDFNLTAAPSSPTSPSHRALTTPRAYVPMSVGDWILTWLLMCIPLVNLFLLFAWAFGSPPRKSRETWAKANLIFLALGLMVYVAVLMGVFAFAF